MAISEPRARRSAVEGTATADGRWSAAPIALASVASVTGVGAVALTGPERGVLEAAHDDADLVVQGDPAPVLRPWTHPPAQPDAEQRELPAQRASLTGEDDPGAEEDGADACRRRRARRLFPCVAQLGEESIAPARRLSQFLVAPVAIEADGRGADQHRRWRRAAIRAFTSAEVDVVRLSMTTRLRATDQRRSPMPAPARWTTPSNGPACAKPARFSVPELGSQITSLTGAPASPPAGEWRTRRLTR